MKKLLFLPFLFASFLWGQSSVTILPDVTQGFTFNGASNGPTVTVKTGGPGGASTWALTWYVSGFSAAKVHLQGSQDCTSFSDITTTALILEGANPTSWTSSTTSNRMVVRAYLPCVRVAVDTVTGSGTLTTTLLGYKGSNATPVGSSSGGSSCGGITPCNVDVVAPLGQQTSAASIPVVLASDESALPTLVACNAQAEVALSGTGYTQIVAASGSTVIKVCKLFVTSSSGGNPTVNTFTVAFGSCAGSPTEAMNAAGITGIDSDFAGGLKSGAGGALCVKEAVAQSDKVTATFLQQ